MSHLTWRPGSPRRSWVMLLMWAGVCASGAWPTAQRPGQTGASFKGGILVVQVDAVVVDAQDRPVTDLSKGDFRILEDGRPQPISELLVITPREAAERTRRRVLAARDVTSNDAVRDGRLITLVLDDLQTLRGRDDIVKRAAARVLDRLGDGDLVATVCTSGRPNCATDFTTDRAALLDAIRGFEARKTRFDREDSIDGSGWDVNLGKAFSQLESLRTLASIARHLGAVPNRRKAIIYLGEGVDADVAHAAPPATDAGFKFDEASADEARSVITEAQRSNVALYALDPRGLTTYQQEGVLRPPVTDDFEPWLDRARVAREGMGWLADQTGGFAAVNTTRFDEAVDHIVRETGSYYVIGYVPADFKADGTFRRIDVEVTRPGLRVRARRGYFAPRPARPEPRRPGSPVSDAITGLLPATGLTVRMANAALRSSRPRKALLLVAASVEYPADSSGPAADVRDEVDLVLQATDMDGKVRGSDRRRVRASTGTGAGVPAAAPGAPRVVRGQFLLQTELAPGRYSLRLGAHSVLRQKAGSVFATVDVPDFDSTSVSMSGLAIGRATGAPAVSRGSARVGAMIPIAPTIVRDFAPGDELLAFVRLYAPRGAASSILIGTKVRAEDGTVMFQAEESHEGEEFAKGLGAVDYLVRVPLSSLPAGTYRLDIGCRRPGVDAPVAVRETVFRVLR